MTPNTKGKQALSYRCYRCEMRIRSGNTCTWCHNERRGKRNLYKYDNRFMIALALYVRGTIEMEHLDGLVVTELMKGPRITRSTTYGSR